MKKLDLAGIGITSLHPDVLEMSWLNELNLMSNDFPEIDQETLRAALPKTNIMQ